MGDNPGDLYLDSARKRFETLKRMSEGAFAQVCDADLEWAFNPECNSLRIQIQHLHGNMLSRWTDFLTSDGEKPWRNRDDEFEDTFTARAALLAYWESGWSRLFDSLTALTALTPTPCKPPETL